MISQERLLRFLLNPKSYPHRPRSVRLVQSHASFVFLAPPFVFKVKKAVNFGFLNFSTLAKRRHFCEREVALNRRLSPGIYLGVVPISIQQGRIRFGAGNQVVEYAVQMRQLSQRHFLDRLVERDEVTPRDLKRLVQVLKRFYTSQHPTADLAAWGRVDRLRISTDENFRQTRRFIGQALSRSAFDAIRFYTDRFYARHRKLFASRIRQKRIRDCHGDLHLEHIHITPGALHIYDCIEFNDRFRYVDVANDAAFLAMDLDYEGRPDLARLFSRQMAAALKDKGMPRLLDFYKCYRAFVRGKVESLHSVAPAAPHGERAASAERARRYFRLALHYAVAASPPMVLVVMGRIASGKSTLARALADELGWPIYSSDRIRKHLARLPLYRRSSARVRKRLYSPTMTKQTYDRLLQAAEDQVKKGRSVILDATFSRRDHRQWLVDRFGNRSSAWRVLEAQASNSAIKHRLRDREAKPHEVSDARLEDFSALTRLYQPPRELSSRQRIAVNTTCRLDLAVSRALRALASLRADSFGN